MLWDTCQPVRAEGIHALMPSVLQLADMSDIAHAIRSQLPCAKCRERCLRTAFRFPPPEALYKVRFRGQVCNVQKTYAQSLDLSGALVLVQDPILDGWL